MAKQKTYSAEAHPVVSADGKRRYTVFETTDGGWKPISSNMTKEELDALYKAQEEK